jgi:hypothetical protein
MARQIGTMFAEPHRTIRLCEGHVRHPPKADIAVETGIRSLRPRMANHCKTSVPNGI